MGTGKVLTEEDFEKGKEPEDTSKGPADRSIPADEKIEIKGKEEPIKEPEPSEKEKEEPLLEPSEDEKKYKYASMDDYDKAYKEAERKMHEATTEKARLVREVEELRKPKDQPKTLQDRIDEMTDQTLDKIRILSTESPTRDRDAARLWAKNQSDIDDLKYEERQRKQDTERITVKRIYDYANKEGLKTDEELDYFAYRYSKTDSSLSIEERTYQAIEATKSGLGKLREGLVKDVEKDKQDKDNLKVLGRGSSRTGKSSEEKLDKPLTMSEQIAQMQEKRRLKKDDLY